MWLDVVCVYLFACLLAFETLWRTLRKIDWRKAWLSSSDHLGGYRCTTVHESGVDIRPGELWSELWQTGKTSILPPEGHKDILCKPGFSFSFLFLFCRRLSIWVTWTYVLSGASVMVSVYDREGLASVSTVSGKCGHWRNSCIRCMQVVTDLLSCIHTFNRNGFPCPMLEISR